MRLAHLLIILIYVVPSQSNEYFLKNFRKLTQNDLNFKATNQISPSPTPVAVENFKYGSAQSPLNNPQKAETCKMVLNKYDVKDYNITACVPFVENGYEASYVLVLNDGDNSHQLNITVFPANKFVENIVVSGHQVKKVNLPSNTGGTCSISLNIENKECVIHVEALTQGHYTSYLTPRNGTFLIFGTALLIGGTLACFKLRKRTRFLNGVPYQELEMGQKDSDPSFTIKTPEVWDQNWDNDWDEN